MLVVEKSVSNLPKKKLKTEKNKINLENRNKQLKKKKEQMT